jgi:hypothetical protein
MGAGSKRQQRRRGPTEKQNNRMCEERSHPAKVSSYCTAAAAERGISLRRESASEEHGKEQKKDPANLTRERGGRGRAIARVPVRAS